MSTQKSSAINKHASILSSPALSQISRDEMNFTPANVGHKKKTSTPFVEKLKAFQCQSRDTQEPFMSSALNEIQNIGVKRKRQRLEGNFLIRASYALQMNPDLFLFLQIYLVTFMTLKKKMFS